MADATTTQIYQNQYGFAPELAPYAQDMLGQASALTDLTQNPYMQYQGDRVAQFSPLQQQSYENAALMQTQPQLQDATATAGLAALGGLNTGYTYNPVTSQFTSPAAYSFNPYANKSFTGQGVAQSYMSPYQQNVTDIQLREAQRMADIASAGRQANLVKQGAYGGSRGAIMDAEAARNLALQKGDITAQGLQSAYTTGMNQFNTEQQAAQAAANLNAQQGQFGAGQSLQAAQAAAQAGQAAANLNAQQGQFGASLGLQGLQTALTGANTLGNLGAQQYSQNMGINQLQNQYGIQQQQQAQAGLTNAYQDFIAQQNYPYKQLGFMSDILRGVPTSNLGTNLYQATSTPSPSPISQMIGLAGAGYTASKMASGGSVDSTRSAGLADLAISKIS